MNVSSKRLVWFRKMLTDLYFIILFYQSNYWINYYNLSIWHTEQFGTFWNIQNTWHIFRKIWSISCSKIFLYFNILTWSSTWNLGSLSLTSLLLSLLTSKCMNALSSTPTDFGWIVLWYVLLYSFTISSYSSVYTFLDIEVMYLYILLYKILV